jgi:multiple sugar transport system permease protein
MKLHISHLPAGEARPTARAPRRRRSLLARREALAGYMFVAPQVLGFLALVLGPVIAVFFFSMQQRNLLAGNAAFVGLDNYQQLMTNDALFRKVLLNSLGFALGLVPLNIALALSLALLLSRPLRGVTFFRMLFFSPVITSAVAWAIVWKFILQNEQGMLNQLLALAGIDGPNWLRESAWAMPAVIVTRVLKMVGLNMLIFLAALKGLPQEYVEAARVDGASSWQVLRRLTLPQLAPTTFMVMLITLIGSLQVFDHIMLLTEGGPGHSTMVLGFYIYYQAFEFFETGYASSLAVILFAITLALTVAQWKLRRRYIYHEQ